MVTNAIVKTAVRSVELTPYEMFLAAQIGIRRQVEARTKGLKDRHGVDPDAGWGIHVEGAAGEMAFAKALDRFYSGSVNTFKFGGDVGQIQVRTRSRDDYELIVRADDKDDDSFVLVCGIAPRFVVKGWMPGREAKRPEWLKAHGGRPPAWFVPQAALWPLESIEREDDW